MILNHEAEVTDAILRALDHTGDPRQEQLFKAFVRHAHAFVREVGLTPGELDEALRFLAALGHHTNESKNEMVVASDIFGISTLVTLLDCPLSDDRTPKAVLGPFYRANAPEYPFDGCIAALPTGRQRQLVVGGRVCSSDGAPLAGAVVDVWQASPDGFYENQDAGQPDMNLRGRFRTDADGRYRFVTLRPAGYPLDTSGPIGEILKAQGRRPNRPAHIHFIFSAADHATLITQLYLDEPDALADDVVLGVSAPLVGSETIRDVRAEDAPANVVTPYGETVFDVVLQPGMPSFPVPPIP